MLDLQNIVLTREGKTILNGSSSTAKRGELTVLLGANGTGKTSLLHLIAGILSRDAGDFEFDCAGVDPVSVEWRQMLSYVLDDGGTIPLLTVSEQIFLQGVLSGLDASEAKMRADHLIDLLELTRHRDYRADDLSAGLKKKLGIATAIVRDAEIFLFDEPFSALDVQAMAVFCQILKILKEQDKIVIISTHSFQLLTGLYDNIWKLAGGRIDEYVSEREVKAFEQAPILRDVSIPWIG